jgi:hypothetical protein
MKLSGNIDGIDDAKIDDNAVGKTVKFILAKVSDRRSSKVILRAEEVGFHNEIYLKLQEELGENFKIDVIGGGNLYLNNNDKTIRLSGASTAFGPPDYKLAQELLQKDYSTFKVVVAP